VYALVVGDRRLVEISLNHRRGFVDTGYARYLN
jgi:hypothetical protein